VSVKKRHALGPLGTVKGTAVGDIAAIAIGAAFWVFMLKWGHAMLIGVPLIP
jgi:hypothetical protein